MECYSYCNKYSFDGERCCVDFPSKIFSYSLFVFHSYTVVSPFGFLSLAICLCLCVFSLLLSVTLTVCLSGYQSDFICNSSFTGHASVSSCNCPWLYLAFYKFLLFFFTIMYIFNLYCILCSCLACIVHTLFSHLVNSSYLRFCIPITSGLSSSLCLLVSQTDLQLISALYIYIYMYIQLRKLKSLTLPRTVSISCFPQTMLFYTGMWLYL
jgi:hypothetical protein